MTAIGVCTAQSQEYRDHHGRAQSERREAGERPERRDGWCRTADGERAHVVRALADVSRRWIEKVERKPEGRYSSDCANNPSPSWRRQVAVWKEQQGDDDQPTERWRDVTGRCGKQQNPMAGCTVCLVEQGSDLVGQACDSAHSATGEADPSDRITRLADSDEPADHRESGDRNRPQRREVVAVCIERRRRDRRVEEHRECHVRRQREDQQSPCECGVA